MRRDKRIESQHRAPSSFRRAVILLDKVIEIFDLPDLDWIAVNGNIYREKVSATFFEPLLSINAQPRGRNPLRPCLK